ncbi:MAG: hypothetical protein JXA21_21960 [Anaerolineae bacterium]|nr:hypothetical protein [Anaerolineae bacterium]
MGTMSMDTLKDALKSLAQSLQVSTIFPAWLFVMMNFYFIVPLFAPTFDLSSIITIAWLISLTLMLSYTLYAFNFPLIRLFEGYKLQDSDFFSRLLQKKLEKYRILKHEPKKQREFDQDYPCMEDRVLPTKIGNTIAAFEDYAYTRYRMDAIALWPRLVPVLKKGEFLDYVVQEKAVFDFLLNTCVVVAVLGLEFFYRSLFLADWGNLFFVIVFVPVALFVLYEGVYIAARQWGTVVRVAFDLYRHDLAQRLCMRPADTFEKETENWAKISHFLLYRDMKRYLRNDEVFIPQSHLLQFQKIVANLESRASLDY